jgi:hypothetical protein
MHVYLPPKAPFEGNCDGCNKHRKNLYVGAREPDGSIAIVYCFFCIKEQQRNPMKYYEL